MSLFTYHRYVVAIDFAEFCRYAERDYEGQRVKFVPEDSGNPRVGHIETHGEYGIFLKPRYEFDPSTHVITLTMPRGIGLVLPYQLEFFWHAIEYGSVHSDPERFDRFA